MVFIRDGLICKVIWTLNIVHTYKHLLVLRFCCNNSQNILWNLHHMDHSLSIYWLRDILFASMIWQLWNKAVINIWKNYILVYTKISRQLLWIIRSKWLQYSNLHLGHVRTNIGNHYMNNKICFYNSAISLFLYTVSLLFYLHLIFRNMTEFWYFLLEV